MPLGAIVNSIGQIITNKSSQRFSRQMYDLQKKDNLEFWAMQNAYNSPQAQMQRFQEAGLNPHLIYGQGNSGNAGAVSTPDVQRPEFVAPRFGDAVGEGLSLISQFYDLEQKQAQTDNLKAQNSVILQESLLKAAQISDVTAGAARKAWDLKFEQGLASTSAEIRKEQLRAARIANDLTIRKEVRDAVQFSGNLKEQGERVKSIIVERKLKELHQAHTKAETARIKADIVRIQKQIDLATSEGIIKKLDAEMAREGVKPSDPWHIRILSQGWNSLVDFLLNE